MNILLTTLETFFQITREPSINFAFSSFFPNVLNQPLTCSPSSSSLTVQFFIFFRQGWWLVDRDGELGWAPASHLEPTDDGAEVTSAKHFAPGKGTFK